MQKGTRKESGKEAGILRKLRTDCAYRRRFVLTLSVSWSYVILGWTVLQIGTALPDIQRLVHIDLETAAWIFTVWSIGLMIGSLVSGRLYDRCNRLVIMMVSTIGMAVCCFSIPYCKGVATLLVIRGFTGLFAGGIDTGANTIVPTIWDNKNGQSFMQALYLAYTLGGIFSPLATKPFMAQSYDLDPDITNNGHHGATLSPPVNIDIRNRYKEINNQSEFFVGMINKTTGDFYNYTTHIGHNTSGDVQRGFTPNGTGNAGGVLHGSDVTQIHVAFMTSGFIVLSASVPYIIMAFLGNFDERVTPDREQPNPETETLSKDNQLIEADPNRTYVSNGRKLWLLGFVASVNILYSAIEDGLGDFLTTYCLFYLQWTKANAVLLVSLYWVASCLGGLAGIFLIKQLGPTRLLVLAYAVWNISFLVAVSGNITRYDTLTWLGFMGAGCAMVIVIPATISWTSENVCEITGKVSSVFLFSSGFGIAANPQFIGFMMEKHSYGNFVYVLAGETFICTLLFACAIAIFSCIHDKPEPSDVINEKC